MPHRALETPLQELPPIDEHAIEIDASADAAWAALFPTLSRKINGRVGRRAANLLKARDVEASGDLHHPGGTLPGFVVARSVAPVMLALMGQNNFSSYALVFRIDLLPGQRCRVRAETRAQFSGRKGFAYRILVVGTGGHRIVTKSLLRSLRRRAERRERGR